MHWQKLQRCTLFSESPVGDASSNQNLSFVLSIGTTWIPLKALPRCPCTVMAGWGRFCFSCGVNKGKEPPSCPRWFCVLRFIQWQGRTYKSAFSDKLIYRSNPADVVFEETYSWVEATDGYFVEIFSVWPFSYQKLK